MSCNLNQFLAAIGTNYLPPVHKIPAILSINLPRRICILERAIAEGANWKLELAASAERNSSADLMGWI